AMDEGITTFRAWRLAMAYTQEQAAEMLGLNVKTCQRYDRGESDPPKSVLLLMYRITHSDAREPVNFDNVQVWIAELQKDVVEELSTPPRPAQTVQVKVSTPPSPAPSVQDTVSRTPSPGLNGQAMVSRTEPQKPTWYRRLISA